MNDQKLKRRVTTSSEREALKVFGQVKTEKAVSEHRKGTKGVSQKPRTLESIAFGAGSHRKGKGNMTPTLFPSVFTTEIGEKPTVTFEAKSLREASEICNAPWLREDFASAHSNGTPLWDGKAELRARMGCEAEIATFGEASKDAQPSDGMLLVYLVELDDNDCAENSEPSSATQLR